MTKEQLGALVLASQETLYRVAKSLLYNDADCGDAIQNTIVKAFSNLDSLKEDRYAKTWMVRILKNECFMIMRKEKNEVSYDSVLQEESYIHEDYSDLYEAVKKLPKDMRLVISLYYAEGFSVKEIARIEDTTESTIKNRLLRARAKLKLLLDGEEDGTCRI